MDKRQQETPKDPHLDIPSVANEEKHINFPAEEEKAASSTVNGDAANREDVQRKQQWRQGIAEGKREQQQQNDFEERNGSEEEAY